MVKTSIKRSWFELKVIGFVITGALLGILLCVVILYSQNRGYVHISKAPSSTSMSHVVETKEAIVINSVDAPGDLVDTLAKDDGGCYKNESTDPQNKYYIRRVDGDFALVSYGCELDARMFYKKTNGVWQGISPTNQFINNIPLCDMLSKNKIPKALAPYCYDEHLDKNLQATNEVMPALMPNPNDH